MGILVSIIETNENTFLMYFKMLTLLFSPLILFLFSRSWVRAGQRALAIHSYQGTQDILLGRVFDCQEKRSLLEVHHARLFPI